MTAADLEQRVVALEKGAQYDATQKAIREREIEFLAQLKEIKEAMAKESGSSKSSAEVQSLEEENKKLKATIAKQDYRIRHLISGMEKLLGGEQL
mmetsp:Transcript_11731/g.18485  ORF Transcript_11731/g.18485 Transcript_11731/m.18485 type:complete len:95 (+) Transcript_11731:92-376(+)|eukprot:CAMPEP_0117045678 /NCGR_PEP_ID=MMETSP0472-20121206/31600_1 /TAXON_ID=693140 ORGANISM="Tiarina fusus, Strain LIS" /NCGR_SAMPLE_ID=MMETSP0472 /ASSEMBLY_ACC=CAM_ASM_000603 /LENGTH=94 /DNA_ID=CAMNT_0004757771 /DNA_START=87 /DNA_END=371 /DNA_ORIENTATION=+